MRRRAFIAAVAAISAGGSLAEPAGRMLTALGEAVPPTRVGAADVVQVEQAVDMFTMLDLRYGGGLAREMAKTQLRWALGLHDAQMSAPTRRRLNVAVGGLAERAGWSTFDADDQEGARALFTLALHAATEADDPNLRAHIMSDIATQQMYLGHPGDCLKVIRLAEGDDRIRPSVRFVLHGVKARAFGALGETEATYRQIRFAEDAYAAVTPETTPEWMTKFLGDAHVYSVTGQAAYALAQSQGKFSQEAHTRLERAIAGFGADRARAVALCATRLAAMHLNAGHLPEGEKAARAALAATPGIRSARIAKDLTVMRSAASRHGDATGDLNATIQLAVSRAGR